MASKGFFEAFREGWTEGSKSRTKPPSSLKPSPRRVRVLTPQKPEPKYQWIREAKYRGQDTSLEPKQYKGLWRRLAKLIKRYWRN